MLEHVKKTNQGYLQVYVDGSVSVAEGACAAVFVSLHLRLHSLAGQTDWVLLTATECAGIRAAPRRLKR